MIIETVVSQHAEEAAFLWILRDRAGQAPNYTLADLARLDARLAAHLEGLAIAGEGGWRLLAENLAHNEAGEVFAAAVVALEARRHDWIEAALATAEAAPAAAPGLEAALGWVEPASLKGVVGPMLDSASPFRRSIAIGACAMHGADPGPALADAGGQGDPGLRSACLRAVGMLKRRDLKAMLNEGWDDPDDECRFWAAFSAGLLADPDAAGRLRAIAEAGGRRARAATAMAVRLMDVSATRHWISALAREEKTMIAAVRAAGVFGDPAVLRWLVPLTARLPAARAAGEAIAWIAGIELVDADLDRPAPEGADGGPNDDPGDDNVQLDEDDSLPWPDPDRLAVWWKKNEGAFANGVRHLCGKPIDEAQLRSVLLHGNQRQRAAAAVELALSHPKEKPFPTTAPAQRQRRLLGLAR